MKDAHTLECWRKWLERIEEDITVNGAEIYSASEISEPLTNDHVNDGDEDDEAHHGHHGSVIIGQGAKSVTPSDKMNANATAADSTSSKIDGNGEGGDSGDGGEGVNTNGWGIHPTAEDDAPVADGDEQQVTQSGMLIV